MLEKSRTATELRLRDYQSKAVNDIRAHFADGRRSALLQMVTGAGKTAVATYMANGAAQRGNVVWFMCHRQELALQSSEAFTDAGINHGLIASGSRYSRDMLVQVVMVGAVRSRMDLLRKPDLVVWDECHHMAAATWRELYEWLSGAMHIGLSATPERLDGSGLGDFFAAMVNGPSCKSLIAGGYLSRYRLFGTPRAPDTTALHFTGGDFNKREVAELMDRPKIVGDSIAHYQRHAAGRSALLFDVSVASSERQADAFRSHGIAAMHVDAGTPDIDRRRAIRDLASGELRVLTNVDLFGEGVSVNNVSCIIQKRPTASLSLHLQQIGRGLRTFAGKEDCVILDHAGNWARHGLPDDERAWSLEGRDKQKKSEPGTSCRQCSRCFAAFAAGVRACPECGHIEKSQRAEVRIHAGQLSEIRESAPPVRQMQARARSIQDLLELGHSKGRAKKIIAAREEKEMLRNEVRRLVPNLSQVALSKLMPRELKAIIAEAKENEPTRV